MGGGAQTAGDFRFGRFAGDGLPSIMLLGGAALGALGGCIAARRSGSRLRMTNSRDASLAQL